MRVRIVSVFIVLLFLSSAQAQEGYPLPDHLSPITPANASQVTKLAAIRSTLPGKLAWSPDGKWLAVGTSTGVSLYDADHLDELPHIIGGGSDVLFDPSGDLLVSGGQLWNVKPGQPLVTVPKSYAAQFSPDGSILVSASTENRQIVVYLWKIQGTTAQPLATLETDSGLSFGGVVFNPDESLVAVKLYGDFDQPAVVQLWNVATGTIIATLDHTYEWLTLAAFTADGRFLITASENSAPYGGPIGEVKLWDGHTGEMRGRWESLVKPQVSPDGRILAFTNSSYSIEVVLLPGAPEPIALSDKKRFLEIIGFSPDGRFLAVVADFSRILLWDVSSGTLPPEPRITITLKPDSFSEVAFSSDGTVLAVKQLRGPIQFRDTRTGQELPSVVHEEDDIFNMSFSPDGKLLLTRLNTGLHLWDLSRTIGGTPLVLPNSAVLNADWSRAAYWQNQSVIVVDIKSSSHVPLQVIEENIGPSAALNPATGQVAFSGDGVRVYNARQGELVVTLPTLLKPSSVTFSPDGKRVAVESGGGYGNSPKVVELWDISAPDQPHEVVKIERDIGDPLFSPDSSLLALHGFAEQGAVEVLLDTSTGEELASWGLGTGGIYSHAFSPDGSLIATTTDSDVVVWDVAATVQRGAFHKDRSQTGVEAARLYRYENIEQMMFSPDGRHLAGTQATYGDGVYYEVLDWNLHDLADPDAQPISPLLVAGHSRVLRFSPSGRFLLTDSWNADTVLLWDSQSDAQVALIPAYPIATFSPDGALLATHGADGLSLWEVAALVKGDVSPLVVLADDTPDVSELAFSVDGTLLFVRSASSVSVWGVNI